MKQQSRSWRSNSLLDTVAALVIGYSMLVIGFTIALGLAIGLASLLFLLFTH